MIASVKIYMLNVPAPLVALSCVFCFMTRRRARKMKSTWLAKVLNLAVCKTSCPPLWTHEVPSRKDHASVLKFCHHTCQIVKRFVFFPTSSFLKKKWKKKEKTKIWQTYDTAGGTQVFNGCSIEPKDSLH